MITALAPAIVAELDLSARSLQSLEFPKIRQAVAAQTAFSASRTLALALHPANDLKTVAHAQEQTREAMHLLEWKPNLSIGGATDVRRLAHEAQIDRVLEPGELLEIRATLLALRVFRATILHLQDQLPALWRLAGE